MGLIRGRLGDSYLRSLLNQEVDDLCLSKISCVVQGRAFVNRSINRVHVLSLTNSVLNSGEVSCLDSPNETRLFRHAAFFCLSLPSRTQRMRNLISDWPIIFQYLLVPAVNQLHGSSSVRGWQQVTWFTVGSRLAFYAR